MTASGSSPGSGASDLDASGEVAVYRACLTPDEIALIEAVPYDRWQEIDPGHWGRRLRADADSVPARRLLPVIWRHFHAAASGRPLEWVDLGVVKRLSGGRQPWHRDTGYAFARDLLLTMSVGLTDLSDYEGGVLRIGHRSHELRVDRGELVVFAPEAVHSVTSVTGGERRTLVTWALGADGYSAGRWLFGPSGQARSPRRLGERDMASYQQGLNDRWLIDRRLGGDAG